MMNTNNEKMTMNIDLYELEMLEEKATDGSVDAARTLYKYYSESGHCDEGKAAYWRSFLDEEKESPEEQEENVGDEITPAEQWFRDYEDGVTEKMMIRDLRERIAAGDPFASLVMADLYADESEQGLQKKLEYYDTARKNAEKLNTVPGYSGILYLIQMYMGNIHGSLSQDPHDEHAVQAFEHYSNALELADSTDDKGAFYALTDCYTKGFGCEQDPEKAEDIHVRMLESIGGEGYLQLAKENQEKMNMLEAVDYLQRSLMIDDPAVRTFARFKLACMSMPADNGEIPAIPESIQEMTREWAAGLNTYLMPEEEETLVHYLFDGKEIDSYADSDNADFLLYAADKQDKSHVFSMNLEDVYIDVFSYKAGQQIHSIPVTFEPEDGRLRNTTAAEPFDETTRQYLEKVLKLYLKAADLGSRTGMYAAGKMYAVHITSPDDPYLAGDYILKAADAGDPNALLLLAQQYARTGDLAAAASYNQQVLDDETADEFRVRIAEVNLAGCCRYSGNENNYQYALELYHDADQAGDMLAPFGLAVMYYEGMGVPVDYVQARQYAQKAADFGIVRAQVMFADMCFNGQGGDKDYAMAESYYLRAGFSPFDEGMRLLNLGYIRKSNGDHAAAMEYFNQAADKGNVTALHELGTMYLEGKIVAQDYSRAMELLNEASDKGNAAALNDLGVMYANGQGTPKDMSTAYSYWEKAAEMGNATAMFNVAVGYRDGTFLQQDTQKAIEWYTKAYENGYAPAANEIGTILFNGEIAERNVAQALYWFENGERAGEATAAWNLAKIYLGQTDIPKNQWKAVQYLERAAELGNADAMNELGYRLVTGTDMVRDAQKAFKWFEKGARAGNIYAMRNLGICFMDGTGIPRNQNQAKYWFEQALNGGNTDAAMDLYKFYSYNGVLAYDPEQAVRYLQIAADAGCVNAFYPLGNHYLNGAGVGQSTETAVKLFEQGAENGVVDSMARLGDLYWKGEKTEKDLQKALYWFKQAAAAEERYGVQVQLIQQEIDAQSKGFLKWFR